jgi:hypothetical protein
MFWKKDKSYIKFHTKKELLDIIPHPVPASKAMPEWFKKIKPAIEGSDKVDAGTIKRCIPVLDAVSQGYIIKLWADLQVKVMPLYNFKDENENTIHVEATMDPETFINKETSVTKEIIKSYEETDELGVWMKFPEIDLGIGKLLSNHGWQQVGNSCDLKKFKLGKVLLKFTNPWIIKTAPGWSVKFQNPANNWSNDIQLIEGIVDTDTYYNEVNFPYVWTGSTVGEYVIPRGTPLVHVIPFKREEVELEVGEADQEEKDRVFNKMHTKHFDRYKNLFWNKRKLEK